MDRILLLLVLVLTVQRVSLQQLEKQQIASYARCKTDKDCKENAFCFGNDDTKIGKCKCIDGYDLNRNRTFYECLKGTKINEACISDFQCKVAAGVLSYCDKYQICKCSESSHAMDGKCYLTSLLDQSCQSNANCLLGDDTIGYCEFGKCICPANERPSADKKSCIPSTSLGHGCSRDIECEGVENTQCSNNICRCKTRFVTSRDDDSCLPVAESLGDPCEEDAQCTKFIPESQCQNSNCTCLSGYHEFKKKCIKTARIGDICKEKSNCIFDRKMENNVDCMKGVCECLYGTSEDSSYGCKLEKGQPSSSTVFTLSLTCMLVFLVNVLFQ